MGAYVYMLECSDGSFYIGSTRDTLEVRIGQHNAGHFGGYTATRRPVRLVWSEHFQQITDAIAAERKLKAWGHAKKAALAQGDVVGLKILAKRRRPFGP
jgi:putative endonuclease